MESYLAPASNKIYKLGIGTEIQMWHAYGSPVSKISNILDKNLGKKQKKNG